MTTLPACASCAGSGEVPTDYGAVDCPDCGGAGHLPTQSVLIDWRARDLERAISLGSAPEPADLRWAIDEMRKARAALTEVIALAHDIHDGDAIGNRIRFVANRALGLYKIDPRDSPS